MNETIEYYNQNADSFISGTINADMSECRDSFLKYVRPGGIILDAGCGSGRDSLVFLEKGFNVDAFDASQEICRRASRLLGVPVKCMRFEDLAGENQYDGIWASASLLHVEEKDLPDVMNRLKKLLKQGGILYASFKEGSSVRIKEGRYFLDMTEDSCRLLLQSAGLAVLEVKNTQDVRADHSGERWINIIGAKRNNQPARIFDEL